MAGSCEVGGQRPVERDADVIVGADHRYVGWVPCGGLLGDGDPCPGPARKLGLQPFAVAHDVRSQRLAVVMKAPGGKARSSGARRLRARRCSTGALACLHTALIVVPTAVEWVRDRVHPWDYSVEGVVIVALLGFVVFV